MNFPCHLYMLFLNEKGEIYPCPRTPVNNLIGYISDPDIVERIIDYVPQECECAIGSLREANSEEKSEGIVNFNMEIGGECNGSCVFCFQKTLSTFRKHFPFYKDLEAFLIRLKSSKTATIFGGEVTVQPETLRLISMMKKEIGTSVTIVTNGAIPHNNYASLCDIIDGFQVSFYGFNMESVRMISKLNLKQIKDFCEYLSEHNRRLDVKFVLSPLVIHELQPFLEWSLSLNVSHVMVYYAILPSEDYERTGRRDVSSFDNLVPEYWTPIIKRVSNEVKSFFIKNKKQIQEKGINYIVNREVLNLLEIPSSFLKELDIPQEKSISISCKAWKRILTKKEE